MNFVAICIFPAFLSTAPLHVFLLCFGDLIYVFFAIGDLIYVFTLNMSYVLYFCCRAAV